MRLLTEPIQNKSKQAITYVHTRSGTVHMLVGLACSEFDPVLEEVLAVLSSPDFAKKLRFKQPPLTDHEVELDQKIADAAWSTTMATIGKSAAFHTMYTELPPLSFLAVLRPSHKDRAMAKMKSGWAVLLKLEHDANTSEDARQFLRYLMFPSNIFVREIFLSGFEHTFTTLHAEVWEELRLFASCQNSTLVQENLNRAVRASEKSDASRRAGPQCSVERVLCVFSFARV